MFEMMVGETIQLKWGPKFGARSFESAPAINEVIGKYTLLGELNAGQKQYVLAEQIVTFALAKRAKSRNKSPPRFTTTVAEGRFSLMYSNNFSRMSLHRLV